MELQRVYCAVRTGSINQTALVSSFKFLYCVFHLDAFAIWLLARLELYASSVARRRSLHVLFNFGFFVIKQNNKLIKSV